MASQASAVADMWWMLETSLVLFPVIWPGMKVNRCEGGGLVLVWMQEDLGYELPSRPDQPPGDRGQRNHGDGREHHVQQERAREGTVSAGESGSRRGRGGFDTPETRTNAKLFLRGPSVCA